MSDGNDAFQAAWCEMVRNMAYSKIRYMLIADYPDDAMVPYVLHLVDEATAREMIAEQRTKIAAFLESDFGKRFMARQSESNNPSVGDGSRAGEDTA